MTRHQLRQRRKRDEQDPNQPHYFFGGDMLYDAIFLSSNEVLKGVQGRKALVLFSDGWIAIARPRWSAPLKRRNARIRLFTVYTWPQSANNSRGTETSEDTAAAVILVVAGLPWRGWAISGRGGYPVAADGERGPQNTPRENKTDGKKILQQIAKETGGKYFELSKKVTAAQIYAQIEEEMRHQYSLSYTPDKAESGYHKLHLSTRNGELTVQTREGFYSE